MFPDQVRQIIGRTRQIIGKDSMGLAGEEVAGHRHLFELPSPSSHGMSRF